MSRTADSDPEWTEDYAHAYSHREPYPVPAGWVLGMVEADGVSWKHYPGIGEGLQHDHEVTDVLDDADDLQEALDCNASVHTEWEGDGDVTHVLSIDGDDVFRAFNADWNDLFATVAEVLSRFANGQDYSDVEPETSQQTPEEKAEAERERRQAENQSLGDYA